jgi:hypothetical protein
MTRHLQNKGLLGACLAVIIVLAGCSTFTDPDSQVRVRAGSGSEATIDVHISTGALGIGLMNGLVVLHVPPEWVVPGTATSWWHNFSETNPFHASVRISGMEDGHWRAPVQVFANEYLIMGDATPVSSGVAYFSVANGQIVDPKGGLITWMGGPSDDSFPGPWRSEQERRESVQVTNETLQLSIQNQGYAPDAFRIQWEIGSDPEVPLPALYQRIDDAEAMVDAPRGGTATATVALDALNQSRTNYVDIYAVGTSPFAANQPFWAKLALWHDGEWKMSYLAPLDSNSDHNVERINAS